MADEKTRGSHDGFILYAVLSVTALLSVLFLSLSLQARSAVDTATVAGLDLAADALLQSGVNLAGYQLFVARVPAGSIGGQQIRLDGGTVTLSAIPQGAKVDLNGAQAPLLEAAYKAAGLRTLAPAAFAERVIDWRDADDDKSKGGAEAADYAAAGVAYRPRNGGFRHVSDLKWVLGVTPSDLKLLAPFVTVYNPVGRLDMTTVGLPLLSALPGMSKPVLDRIEALRTSPQGGTRENFRTVLAEQAALFDFDPPTSYSVSIVARPNGASRSTRVSAVLIASADKSRAFQIVGWRRQ